MPNPFHASFGVSPPLMVGRESVLADFVEALEDGPGSSGRATLYTGARGAGKTVMLNAVEERARTQGWLVVSETATPGFIERMTQQAPAQTSARVRPRGRPAPDERSEGPLSIGRLDWDTIEKHVVRAGLRNQIEVLTDLLAEHSTGVLMTLDEIHHNQLTELRELATTVQHAFRGGRELAFVGAGLAASVSDVVNASQYRLRLIAAELIYPTRRGYVDFALPYLREYLRDHAAADV